MFVPVDIGSIKLDGTQPPSRGRTILDQGLQGVSFGFADEITDRLGAGIASLATDESYGNLLDQARAGTKERMAQQMEQRPALSIGSQLAGALLTGGAGATTKAGTALSNSLRSGALLGKELGLAGRIAKGAAAGATASGITGFGSGSGLENRIDSGADSLAAGAAVGAAFPIAGSAVNKALAGGKTALTGLKARGTEELTDAAQSMRDASAASYGAMRSSGATFNPSAASRIVSDIESKIAADGLTNAGLHGKALGVIDDLKGAAAKGDFSLEGLDQYRQLLGEVAGNFNDPSNARKAKIAIKAIDEVVDSLGASDLASGDRAAIDALQEGRRLYAKTRRFENVAEIVKKSDGDANYLKRELKKLSDKVEKNRGMGYSQQEREALKRAGSLTNGEAILKMLGKFGFDAGNSRIGSGVGALVGGAGVGAVVGTPAGIAAPVAGTAARYGQKLVARGKAEDLLQAIEGIAPSASRQLALPKPVATAPAIGLTGSTAEPVNAMPAMQGFAPIDINTIKLDNVPGQQSNLITVTDPNTGQQYQVTPQEDLRLELAARQGKIEQPRTATNLQSKIKQAESAGDPNAKNPNSSASGLFQFTDSTWNSAVDKWGRSRGIKYSDKNNPEAQQFLAEKLTQDNARILQNKGIEPTDGNLYFAHFMGAPAASKAISMLGKGAIAARSFPSAAAANRSIFYDGSRPRTVDEVYELITSKVV